MTAPMLVLDAADFASPVSVAVTAGVFSASRLPIPTACTCAETGFECLRCFLDADHAYNRAADE